MTSPIYSDYTLEAFVNGSLPRAEIQAIEDASQTDHILLERIESLRTQNQAFLDRYPVQGAWVEVERRLKTSPTSQSPSSGLRLAFALSSAVALALVLLPQTKMPAPDDNGIRLKGAISPSLELYNVRPGAKIDRWQEGQVLAAGATLQVVVRGALNQYVKILSVDGLEAVTLHYPKQEQAGLIQGERFFVALIVYSRRCAAIRDISSHYIADRVFTCLLVRPTSDHAESQDAYGLYQGKLQGMHGNKLHGAQRVIR